jgi:surface protein
MGVEINGCLDNAGDCGGNCYHMKGSGSDPTNGNCVTDGDQKTYMKSVDTGGVDLSKWNTARVTSMYEMFFGASSFAGVGLHTWDTGSVTTLERTFKMAVAMKSPDLGGWKTSKVQNMQGAFNSAAAFTGNGLSKWDVSSVTNMAWPFYLASSINADLGSWDVSKVASMVGTFNGATSFTGAGLSTWNIEKARLDAKTFLLAPAISNCTKRAIFEAWTTPMKAVDMTTHYSDWATVFCDCDWTTLPCRLGGGSGIVGGPADPTSALLPASCWEDFLLEVQPPRTSSSGAGVKLFPFKELSARVNATAYSENGTNDVAFLPLGGLFLAFGGGGERATIVLSDDSMCAQAANMTLSVSVGGIVAPLHTRSTNGLRTTVTLPSYDDVCVRSGQCNSMSNTITVTEDDSTEHGLQIGCKPGYERSDSGQYCYRKYETKGVNWTDARVVCQTDGTDLAIVGSEEDDSFIKKQKWTEAWFGLNDRAKEGTFVNVDGTVPAWVPAAWAAPRGEPNNFGGNEDCAVLGYTDGTKWNDYPCTKLTKGVACGHSTQLQMVSWSCPPLCPGQAMATSQRAANPSKTPTDTDTGGITYVQRCTKGGRRLQQHNESAPPSSSQVPTVPPSSQQCANAMKGLVSFVTDPRSCLDPVRARSAPCAYGEGGSCQCCPENARCPGGARMWPARGYWAKNESSTLAEICDPPRLKRCLGMVHGSMTGDRQCGDGYKGWRCGQCANKGTTKFYADQWGACVTCGSVASSSSSSSSSNSTGEAQSTMNATDALWFLALALALCFGAVFAVVFFIQRRQGGSLVGGLFRAMDFFCYLVILLQTTLYIANGAVKNALDVVLGEYADDAAGRFIKSFYGAIAVFQLDFSGAVKLSCLGGDPLVFQKAYAALTCLVVLVYVAALLVLPRLRLFERILAYSGLSKPRKLVSLLYQQFAYRMGTWLVLTHAVSCRIALSGIQCVEVGGGSGGGEGEGDSNVDGPDDSCRDSAWGFLVVFHILGFPLAILVGAIRVRSSMMGGTCCHDTKETMQRHNDNIRATGELGLWRYYLDYDYKARFHWFRAANMAVMFTIVLSETTIRPEADFNQKQIGEVDLTRTCIQATAVIVYLTLLLVAKPYVHSRLRRWKMWVTVFNQGTTLLLILTRLLAEQARAYGEVERGVARPPIFDASLAFMYISTASMFLQFVVLGGSFLWSLREGAQEEQVIIIEKKEAAERQEQARLGGGVQDSGKAEAKVVMMVDNPMCGKHGLRKSVKFEDEPKDQDHDYTDDWDKHLDAESGSMYYENRRSGKVTWELPGDDDAVEETVVVEEVKEEEWVVHTCESSGRRYKYNNWTGETVWIDPEEEEEGEEEEDRGEEWTMLTDESSGRRYKYNNWTGETVWIDPEQEEEEDGDDLATARARLRSVMKQSTNGDASAIDSAFLELVSDTRGDWVEVCDPDGSVLGWQLKGCTVYYNRLTYETRLTKPPGWVLMQCMALTGEGRASMRL